MRFISACRKYSSEYTVKSIPEFEAKWSAFFDSAEDLFEVQRGLNNTFGYDWVPTAPILEAAMRAARRLDDFPTAMRVLSGLKNKMPKKKIYEQYMEHLKPLREELGLPTPEEINLNR